MNANVISLDGLAIGSKDALTKAMESDGCSSSSCGSSDAPEDMDPATWEKV